MEEGRIGNVKWNNAIILSLCTQCSVEMEMEEGRISNVKWNNAIILSLCTQCRDGRR